MPEPMGEKLKLLSVKSLYHSRITRAVLAFVLLSLYYLFVSPHFEKFLVNAIGQSVQANSMTQMNALSPVFDIHVYSAEYSLSSNITEANKTGISRFLTLDPRVLAMNKFLTDYHSPMAQYSSVFISEADKYGLDWRLVASISGVESAFGNIIPGGDSNNGWGWRGINKDENGWSVFATWPDGIKEITRGLSQGYGVTLTPFEIEPAYCPPCAEGSAHAWANGVTRFMNELDYYVDNLDNQ
ncbi:glucosaminidase domain-containing protein [Patescibacteria group bacterium]|nr:glucosaminidase domain-containing protein [Patescibacteria group bacterium]